MVNFIVDISHEKRKLICLLTQTSHNTPEDVAPGGGRGGAIGGGGEPLRYAFTSRGWGALHPWTDTSYVYSMLQINMGSNFIGNLEVVSQLNLLSQARYTYHYNYQNCTSRYYPKLYLGTSQTIARYWNSDSQTGINYPSIWPQNGTQKGEANTGKTNILNKDLFCVILY